MRRRHQDIPIIEKSNMRVRKRTEAPTFVSHILGQAGARRLSAAAPDHGGSRGMVLDLCGTCASKGTHIGLPLITVSLERKKARE